jgi:AhpD family alkylhydroperoxidase
MRLDYSSVAPQAYRAMGQLEYYVRNCGLEHSLLELVRIRASQINACAYCIDRHTNAARTSGENEHRLSLLTTWRTASCYTPRERAALAWTEELTLIASHRAPDELYQQITCLFTDEEMVNLTVAICSINAWNRLIICFRTEVGQQQTL